MPKLRIHRPYIKKSAVASPIHKEAKHQIPANFTFAPPGIASKPQLRPPHHYKHTPTIIHDSLPPLPPSSPTPKLNALFEPPPPLASSRYTRHLLLPQLSVAGQQALLSARILIIGLGGLGSPAALYLAAAGVGTLGFVDGDVVEESNLQRQVIHTEGTVGWGKVKSAVAAVRMLNGGVKIRGWEQKLGGGMEGNVWGIFDHKDEVVGKGWDLVLDCTDNPATRYLISDACVIKGISLVSGAAQRFDGQLMVLNYETMGDDSEKNGSRGPCYRCIFPRPPDPEMVRGCSEIGVLGTAVGTIGVLMANEAIRMVVDGGKRKGRAEMLLFNAWAMEMKGMWRCVGLRGAKKDCVACGDEEVLHEKGLKRISRERISGVEGRLDYESWCGVRETVKVLAKEQRASATDFINEVVQGQPVVVDTRETYEVAMGMKVKRSISIPFSRIVRDPQDAFDGLLPQTEMTNGSSGNSEDKIYFLCHQGNDSQIAAKKLLNLRDKKSQGKWIGDVEGGFVAIEKLAGSMNLP